MIRVVLFLVVVALFALGFAWMADRPGDVAVTWLGYRIETSVTVAFLALVVVVLVLTLLWSTLRAVLRSPEQISLFFRHRRAMRGYNALSRGLIAVGAGDARVARRAADEAARLTPGDPLTLLLTAQSAQMSGDRASAERAFRAMTLREETKLLGLRGLYVEAQRRNDPASARRAAEEAAALAPGLSWAGQALLDYRCAEGDWAGALEALERMKHTLDREAYRRKRAVLLTARAQALEETDRETALALVLQAVKLAPDLVPAAAMAGRRLAEAGEQRKARRILEAAWAAHPHPDIAEAYANLRFGDTARDRLARMQKLADKASGHIEGAIAVAAAALEASEFAAARAALAPYLSAPTRRVATLMAEIEEREHGDTGRMREWMARAMRATGDPAWTADGVVSDRWLPLTPDGKLDGFEWRVPLAQIGLSRPVIEVGPHEIPAPLDTEADEEEAPATGPAAGTAPAAVPVEPTTGTEASAPEPDTKPDQAPPAPPVRQKSRATEPAGRTRVAEQVIPLVHAPDDPGPDAGADGEPVPEPSPPRDAWHRFRQLFR